MCIRDSDNTAQAFSSMLDMTGYGGGAPITMGAQLGNLYGGMHLALGIVLAVINVRTGGEGQIVDCLLYTSIVKDNIDVEGMVTTNGSLAMSGNVAEQDAEIVAALKEAGGIIVAKANMDKYAEHSQYSISDFGRVNNAFDLSKSSYEMCIRDRN